MSAPAAIRRSSRSSPTISISASNIILGGGSYIAVAAFRKSIEGFTVNGNVTVPFSDLAQYGITFDTLTPTQQAAITSRGGPGTATVVLTQQVNANGRLIVNGLEGTWVQSLDFLLGRYLGISGFGFSVNGTIIDQKRHRRRRRRSRSAFPRTPTTPPSITRITASARGSRRPGPRASQSSARQPERHHQCRPVRRRLPAVGFLLELRSLDRCLGIAPSAAADLRRGQHLQGGAAFLLPVRECRLHLLPAGPHDHGRPARPLLAIRVPTKLGAAL